MSKSKKDKEKIELDKAKEGKPAEDCSVFIEDMLEGGEEDTQSTLAEEAKKRKKKARNKKQ